MNASTLDEGFSRVDKGTDPRFFVRSLDLQTSLPFYQAYKQQTFMQMRIQAGHHLLDVGCGTGDDVRTMVQLVGRHGRVVGVDLSETMVNEARARAAHMALPVEFHLSCAYPLAFPSDTFDACRSDRTFEHLDDPSQALNEMVRVTKSGGMIAVVDPDLDTLVLDADDHEVVRRFLNFRADTLRCGWIAHRAPALFKQAGLQPVEVIAMTQVIDDYATADGIFRLEGGVGVARERGVLSADEAHSLVAFWERADAHHEFFMGMTYFITSGQKPSASVT